MRTLTRLSLHLSLLAIVAGPLLAACGDNNTTPGDIDAAGGDDAPPDADTSVDADLSPTVASTIAVFDSTLTDPLTGPIAGLASIRGGTIRISYSDLTEGGGEELYRGGAQAPIASCLVTRFDPTHVPNPRLDAGPITISTPATGASALLKTVGPCTLQSPFGEPDPYVCISHNATGVTVTAIDQSSPADTVAYAFSPGPTFGNAAVVSAVRAADVTTITTAAAHGFAVGDLVTISGVTTTSFNAAGVAIVAVPTTTSFTYANDGTPDSEAGTVDPTVARATVPARVPRLTGSALVVNGFTNTDFNSGAGAFPIIAHNPAAPNILVVRNAPPAATEEVLGQTGVSYTILNGFTPVPTFGAPGHDFLGGSAAPGATSSIRIQKAASAVWPAVDFTVDVPGNPRVPVALTTVARASNVVTATTSVAHDFIVGQVLTVASVADTSFNTATATVLATPTTTTFTYAQTDADANSTGGTAVKPGGFTLDAGSNLPHAFPSVAADQSYGCDNDTTVGATAAADDTCGDESTTALKAVIISGSASRKSVGSLLPFQMPTEVPGVDTWLEWTCAYLLSKSGEMPTDAVAAILGFQPSRVEQQVLFVAGTLLDGPGTTNAGTGRILAGHALAGHTTMCPAAGAPPPAATITAISRTGNNVTVTTSAPHNFMPGQTVTIAGVTDTSFNSTTGIIAGTGTINGAVVQFVFGQAGADATSTAGTASVQVAHKGTGGPVCNACNDGIDNDADGLIDFAADTVGASTAGSGCTDLADASE